MVCLICYTYFPKKGKFCAMGCERCFACGLFFCENRTVVNQLQQAEKYIIERNLHL